MIEEEKNYINAKNDVLKAIKSIEDLTPQQKESLAKELFGVEILHNLYNMMQQYFIK